MNHFHPLNWNIQIPEFTTEELTNDPTAQSVFLHEYLHYVQMLLGTTGRRTLVDMVKLCVRTGLHKHYAGNIPKHFEQIDLRKTLKDANAADFVDSDVRQDFQYVLDEWSFLLADEAILVSDVVAAHEVVRHTFSVGKIRWPDFPHLMIPWDSNSVRAVPLTERVIFENMARAVQRNFLYFTLQDTEFIDQERKKPHRDITYVCIRDYLENALPSDEDAAKWTIGLCHLSLSCNKPWEVMAHLLLKVKSVGYRDWDHFMNEVEQDIFISDRFNIPDAQQEVSSLIERYGTAIRPSENYQVLLLARRVADAFNILSSKPLFFYEPAKGWEIARSWVGFFGLPPVLTKDGQVELVAGHRAESDWFWYLERTCKLLGP